MTTFGNILWLVLAGIWMALGYLAAGLFMCVFIVTIPFGVQCFKLAGLALWPFGKAIVDKPGKDSGTSTIANVIWLLLPG